MRGNVRIADDSEDAYDLILDRISNGDSATYRYLDFDGEDTFTIRMRSDANCRVELYIDGAYHTDFKVPVSEQSVQTTVRMPEITGRHTLTLSWYGNFSCASVQEFAFEKERA